MNNKFKHALLVTALGIMQFFGLAYASTIENLDVTFSMQQSSYSATEPLTLDFTYTNNTAQAITLLKWGTPLEGDFTENMLSIHKGGEVVPYIGKRVKRAPPQDSDYVTIGAGEFVKASLELSDGYAIESKGHYSVDLQNQHGKRQAVQKKAQGKSYSAADTTVTFALLGDKVQPDYQQKLAQFSECDANQKSLLDTALANAASIATESKDILNATPENDQLTAARYREWFGTHSTSRYSTVKDHFSKIHDVLANKQVIFNCNCDPEFRSAFAYVNSGDSRNYITLCDAFWAAGATGHDSKAGTLIHEASHFNRVAGTDDHAYGTAPTTNLASIDGSVAIDNADNHEYFAENSPVLAMSAGTAAVNNKDGFEPDDTSSTARTITLNDTQVHTIVPALDEDWLMFTLDDVTSIVIQTSGDVGDTELFLYSENGVLIKDNDDISSSNFFSKIVTPDLVAGTYRVKVQNYKKDDEVANYSINVTIGGTTGSVAENDTYTVVEDGSIQLNPLDNDTQSGSETLSVYSLNGVTLTEGSAQNILVPNGAVAITANGVMTFTPDDNYHGVITFPYEIKDASSVHASAEQQITVTSVNDNPTAENDNYSTEKNTHVALTPLRNDSDVDGDSLSINSINGVVLTHLGLQVLSVSHGSVSINTLGDIVYQPQDDFKGSSVFFYTVTDSQGGEATSEITITVIESEEETPTSTESAGGSFNIGFLFLLGLMGVYNRRKAS